MSELIRAGGECYHSDLGIHWQHEYEADDDPCPDREVVANAIWWTKHEIKYRFMRRHAANNHEAQRIEDCRNPKCVQFMEALGV